MENCNRRTIDILNKQQLLKIAKKLQIKGYSKMRKEDLKNAILTALKNNNHTKSAISNPTINKSISNYNSTVGCLFPKVNRLVAIGDIHGDLSVAIKSLKLAGVINLSVPNNSVNVNDIEWKGGNTFIVQIGDQIDRVRPSNWNNDSICDSNDSELYQDEGSDLKIFSLFENLHKQAQKYGGAVLSLLGNHELMNVVGDFRYVSPNEFREFGNFFNAKKTLKRYGTYPFGYKERKEVFKPGGILAKKLALTRYSILQVGSWIFVHGGVSPELAKKFTLDEINSNIRSWLLGNKDSDIKRAVNELFHNDDDTRSPFWCRIYSDPEDWDNSDGRQSFYKALNFLNIKNKRTETDKIKGMIMGHTPQYMYNKGINSECNGKLWRIDIGASRAFGLLNPENGDDISNRKVQVLLIQNDEQCRIIKEK